MLGLDVHGHLAQVQVGADARRGGDPRGVQHVQDHAHGQLPGREPVGVQVGGGVHEYLVNGINVDVLRGDILQVYFVDLGAYGHVAGHLRRGHQVIHRQGGGGAQGLIVPGGAGEPPSGRLAEAAGVDLPDLFHHLEQPGPPRQAIGLQGGGHRQADGLFRPGGVRHHQVGGHGVQPPVPAGHGGIKGFQVNGDVLGLPHGRVTSLPHRAICQNMRKYVLLLPYCSTAQKNLSRNMGKYVRELFATKAGRAFPSGADMI